MSETASILWDVYYSYTYTWKNAVSGNTMKSSRLCFGNCKVAASTIEEAIKKVQDLAPEEERQVYKIEDIGTFVL